MGRRPLASAFVAGFLVAAGALGLAALVLDATVGMSTGWARAILIGAIVAGLAGGSSAIGWAQGWRDAVRILGAVRANPVIFARARWPIPLQPAQDRLRLVAEQRDHAVAAQTFVQQRLEAIVSG